jgi:hypothetical protein
MMIPERVDGIDDAYFLGPIVLDLKVLYRSIFFVAFVFYSMYDVVVVALRLFESKVLT